MPRRAARVTQADIARAIRAARQAGASSVAVDAEGVIRIALTASAAPIKGANDLDEILVVLPRRDRLSQAIRHEEVAGIARRARLAGSERLH